jgi:hypothetical protein
VLWQYAYLQARIRVSDDITRLSKFKCRLAVQYQCVAPRLGCLNVLRSYNTNTLIYEHLTTHWQREMTISTTCTQRQQSVPLLYIPLFVFQKLLFPISCFFFPRVPVLLYSSTSICWAQHHGFTNSCASRRGHIWSFPIQPFTRSGIRISHHVRNHGCSAHRSDGNVPKLVLCSFCFWMYR